MTDTKISIADCSTLLWGHAKEIFPQGPINCRRKKESQDAYASRYRQALAYVNELDRNDAVLIERHVPEHRALTRDALIQHVNNELPKNRDYRADKLRFAEHLAEKYKSGVCGEIVRVLQDYAINHEMLKEHSYAHIQLASLSNRADIYHEFLVIGLTTAELQALLNKNFNQCGKAVVLDYWSKDRYYVKQLPEKLVQFSNDFKATIAKGFEETGYSVHCWLYSQAAPQLAASEENGASSTNATGSLQQSAALFGTSPNDGVSSSNVGLATHSSLG